MPTALQEVAADVFRLGDARVNWWLVRDGREALLVDGGLPGHRPQLDALLAALGLDLSAVTAGVVTHGHVDHLSCLSGLQRDRGLPVHAPAADIPLATKRAKPEAKVVRHSFNRPTLRTTVAYVKAGVLSARPLVQPLPLDGPTELDLPGRPRFVPAPGHTEGSGIVVLADRSAVCSGDVLVTLDPFSGRTGPRTLPAFDNADHAQGLASLDRLAEVDAAVVLPGHGEPWPGPPAEAVAAARQAELTGR